MIVFLQNAWSPVYAGREWPRDSWLRALERSRSGQRLRVMIDDFSVCENITRAVGARPHIAMPADDTHVNQLLQMKRPRIVVACGKLAEMCLLRLWQGPLLVVPHPAHRLLTDELYRQAKEYLRREDFADRIALRQGNGQIFIERLNHGRR